MDQANSIGNLASGALGGHRPNALSGQAELLILCARIGFNPPA